MSSATPIPRVELAAGRNAWPTWLNFYGMWALFWFTVRRLLGGRRLLAVSLLFLLPSLLTLLIRSQGGHETPAGIEQFTLMGLIPFCTLPFTALLFTSGLIQDEVEEQTLTYPLLRPLPRWLIYVIKLKASVLSTIIISTLFTIVNVCVIRGVEGQPDINLTTRWSTLSLIYALALVAYSGIFGLVGLIFRKSLPVGVIYIIFIEGALASIEFIVRKLTVVYYERVLMARWLEWPNDSHPFGDIRLDESPTASECVITLLGMGIVLSLVAAIVFHMREMRVKTPEAT